jgi:hypothetical protein
MNPGKLPKLPDPERLWAWWNERVSFETKAALAVLAVVGLVVGGWLAAAGLGSAHATNDSAAKPVKRARSIAVAVRTVERVVTVRRPGKVIKERVPVTKTVYERAKQTPAKPGPTRTTYLTRTVLRTVPSYHAYPVTQPAKTVTQTVTQVVTKTVQQIQWRVLKVVNPVTVTVTVTSP